MLVGDFFKLKICRLENCAYICTPFRQEGISRLLDGEAQVVKLVDTLL